MVKWTVEFEEDVITVENTSNKCLLYINEREVDSQGGFMRGSLVGRTSSGDPIRAFLCPGLTKTRCSIYIDSTVVFKI